MVSWKRPEGVELKVLVLKSFGKIEVYVCLFGYYLISFKSVGRTEYFLVCMKFIFFILEIGREVDQTGNT